MRGSVTSSVASGMPASNRSPDSCSGLRRRRVREHEIDHGAISWKCSFLMVEYVARQPCGTRLP